MGVIQDTQRFPLVDIVENARLEGFKAGHGTKREREICRRISIVRTLKRITITGL